MFIYLLFIFNLKQIMVDSKENGGYLINNAFSTTYFDNSKSTLIFAMFDDSFATLTVGSGLIMENICFNFRF